MGIYTKLLNEDYNFESMIKSINVDIISESINLNTIIQNIVEALRKFKKWIKEKFKDFFAKYDKLNKENNKKYEEKVKSINKEKVKSTNNDDEYINYDDFEFPIKCSFYELYDNIVEPFCRLVAGDIRSNLVSVSYTKISNIDEYIKSMNISNKIFGKILDELKYISEDLQKISISEKEISNKDELERYNYLILKSNIKADRDLGKKREKIKKVEDEILTVIETIEKDMSKLNNNNNNTLTSENLKELINNMQQLIIIIKNISNIIGSIALGLEPKLQYNCRAVLKLNKQI